jgi:uncharacterized protein YjiS (DUF1127 family)
MDDYVLSQARFAGDLPGTGILARLWSNWLAKRATAALLNLDDVTLRDIGVTREDVSWAANRPLGENASTALANRVRWKA